MKKTLQKINSLLSEGIIKKYAIAGGIAQFYYIEPSVTYDLDLVVNIEGEGSTLEPLANVYEWAGKNNYSTEEEHIVIEGIAVQFLLAYNDLVKEALENANQITLFNEETYIFAPEYLMAIMLQTGRSTDLERLTKFFNEAEFDMDKFEEVITRFDLLNHYNKFQRRFNE